jgi:hypothetical protein
LRFFPAYLFLFYLVCAESKAQQLPVSLSRTAWIKISFVSPVTDKISFCGEYYVSEKNSFEVSLGYGDIHLNPNRTFYSGWYSVGCNYRRSVYGRNRFLHQAALGINNNYFEYRHRKYNVILAEGQQNNYYIISGFGNYFALQTFYALKFGLSRRIFLEMDLGVYGGILNERRIYESYYSPGNFVYPYKFPYTDNHRTLSVFPKLDLLLVYRL